MAVQSTTAQTTHLRVLNGLHLGLPGYWYPILLASDLGTQPIGLTRFGKDLLVWRGTGGTVHVFEDRCCHRAARLSTGAGTPGKIRSDTIACWYHGWRFDARGCCVETPFGPPDRHARVAAYASAERGGYIWMFYGDGEPSALAIPPELEDPCWCVYRTSVQWRTNWLNILDNGGDPLHQYVLHATAYTTRRRQPFNRVRVVDEGRDGLRIFQYREDERGAAVEENAPSFVITLPSFIRVDLENAAPGGTVMVTAMVTPIDEEHSYMNFFRGRCATGLRRLQWQAIWHLFYRRAVNRIASQDEAMLSTMGPLAETRGRERLASSDAGVIHYRRLLYRGFEERMQASGNGQLNGSATLDAIPDPTSGEVS